MSILCSGLFCGHYNHKDYHHLENSLWNMLYYNKNLKISNYTDFICRKRLQGMHKN